MATFREVHDKWEEESTKGASTSAREERKKGRTKAVRPSSLRSRKVEAIEIHHLAPCRREVAHKRLLGVVACVDFRDGPELRV